MPIFPVLRELYLEEMPKLERWLESVPQSSVSKSIEFPCLEKLGIEGCPNLKSLPSHFPSLTTLRISDIDSLALKELSLSQVFPVMERFELENCSEIIAFPDIRSHTCLQELEIRELEKLTSVPELCKSLHKLILYGCDALVSFPDFRYLRSLDLNYTYRSTEESGPSHLSLPFSSEFNCLQVLYFGRLPVLKSLPEQIQHLTALTSLRLFMLDGLESLPDWLGNLISLQALYISRCKKLKYLPEQIQHLTALTSLRLYDLASLESLPEGLGNLISLQALHISYCEKFKYLPEQIQHLTALTSLHLEMLDGLESLPEGLGNLISLQGLSIWECKKLKYFPSMEAMRRLVNLRNLVINRCPLLEKGFTKRFISEWRKISHIRTIYFNGRAISRVDDIKVSDEDD